jgi:hypothetical protein
MTFYPSTKAAFRADILAHRVEEKILGFFQRALGKSVGKSMSRRIPNGSWCLFLEPFDGSRNGKVVIVQSRDIQDLDTGGQYTVKIYRSAKTVADDSCLIEASVSSRGRTTPHFNPCCSKPTNPRTSKLSLS